MAVLPIPPDIFFSDFEFSLQTYSIIRNHQKIGSVPGLINYEKRTGKDFIHFKLEAQVSPGDVLECEGDLFLVTKVSFDTYEGQKALLRAYIVDTF